MQTVSLRFCLDIFCVCVQHRMAHTTLAGIVLVLSPTCRLCRPRQGVRQCQDCERSNPSSQTHAPLQYPEQAPPGNQPTGPGQTLNLKPVAVRRTPRKRTLTLQDQDMVDTPMEARGHVRGSREMSRDDSSDAQEQETARFLNGQLACILDCILVNHPKRPFADQLISKLVLVSSMHKHVRLLYQHAMFPDSRLSITGNNCCCC